MHSKYAIRSTVLLIALLATMMMFLVPMPVSAHYETPYEHFGPRVDNILIKMYSTESAEFAAFLAGDIDVVDWPLSKAFKDDIETATDPISGLPYSDLIQMDDYHGEYGMFVLDVQNNMTRDASPGETPGAGGSPWGQYYSPTYIPEVRHAIAHLVDRDYIANVITGGLAEKLYTHVGGIYGGYSLDPSVYPDPGYPGYYLDHEYAPSLAAQILNDAGIVDGADADSWREYPAGHPLAGTNMDLQFFTRSDHAHRTAFADKLIIELTAVGLKSTRWPGDSGYCYEHVMTSPGGHQGDLYTGGWLLGSDPDHDWYLYATENYWEPGWAPNYMHVQDPVFDDLSFIAAFPEDTAEAIDYNHLAQKRMAEGSFNIPLWAASSPKAHRKYYGAWGEAPYSASAWTDPTSGMPWTGFVNELGYGYNSEPWTWSNARPVGYDDGAPGATIRYGFKAIEVQKLNPIYSSWYWDWEILSPNYMTLVEIDPYDKSFAGDIPAMAEFFEIGKWANPATGEDASKIVFVMRDDVYFSDDTQVTVDDVIWTWKTMPDRLIANGAPAPWWYPSIADIVSIEVDPSDPWRFTVYLAYTSVWYIHTIGGMIVLPKHIWEPMVPETMTPTQVLDIQAFQPDPNLIGNGPWKFVSYTAGDTALLTANKPASQGFRFYSPKDVQVVKNADGTGIYVIDFNRYSKDLWTRKKVTVNGVVEFDGDEMEPGGQTDTIYGVLIEEIIPSTAAPWTVTVAKLEPLSPITETATQKNLPPQWEIVRGPFVIASPTLRGDINLDATVDIYDAIHMTVYFGVDYTQASRATGYPKFPEHKTLIRTASIDLPLTIADVTDASHIAFNYGKSA